MSSVVMSEEIKDAIRTYLNENRPAELINTYLCFIENKFKLQPVLYPKEKIIFQSGEDAVKKLDKEDKISREAEIKITFSNLSVNEDTKKIYICPFCGKVFGDNTHPNPQDAIYDHVAKCPENTERVGGLRAKRFFVSEDPEVIRSYITTKTKEPIVKKVYTSVLSGKLFNTREAVYKDFQKNYLKRLTLVEVQNQNKFQIEESFLDIIQDQLKEDKITSFVESLAEIPEFAPYVEMWLE